MKKNERRHNKRAESRHAKIFKDRPIAFPFLAIACRAAKRTNIEPILYSQRESHITPFDRAHRTTSNNRPLRLLRHPDLQSTPPH